MYECSNNNDLLMMQEKLEKIYINDIVIVAVGIFVDWGAGTIISEV